MKNSSLINAIAKHNMRAYKGILCLWSLFMLKLFKNGGKNLINKNTNTKNKSNPIITDCILTSCPSDPPKVLE